MKKYILLIIMIISTLTTVNSADIKNSDYDVILSDISMVNWENNEKIIYKKDNSQEQEKLKVLTENLVQHLYDSMKDNSNTEYQKFLSSFKKMDPFTKEYIHKNVINRIIEILENEGRDGLILTRQDPIYLPGYGYTDPDYLYRFGKELSSEKISEYWKTESVKYEAEKKYKTYVKLDIATQIAENGGAAGDIDGFKITGKAMVEINGKIVELAECEFHVKETVVTNSIILMEKRKVSFEVFRAKLGFLLWIVNGMDFDWKLDGNCFLYKEFPASTDQMANPTNITNLTDDITGLDIDTSDLPDYGFDF